MLHKLKSKSIPRHFFLSLWNQASQTPIDTCLFSLILQLLVMNIYFVMPKITYNSAKTQGSILCVCSILSDSVGLHGLQLTRLLHPWDFPGKDTGMGCHFRLQGIFLTQGSNRSPALEADALTSEPPGKPLVYMKIILEIICKSLTL